MKYFLLGVIAFCSLVGDAFAQIAVQNEEALRNVRVGRTAILDGEESGGWNRRVAFYKARGDGLRGDPGYYMYPFTSAEMKKLKDVQGVWTCYRRDQANYTKGAFHFGRNDKGDRFSTVNRQVQLSKGLSADQKKLISAGQVVAAIVAIYAGDPTIYAKGSKAWEEGINVADQNNTNKRKRIDMTPTIIDGKDRWLKQGIFTLTVKRYYNCGVTLRYKLG
ncbi:hypothetical protein NKH85_17105 [Mesorhizobium sp. M0924]|uniref:hypothetical protein n=1 Tax=unclassified Mesorhizobium TaxID=325217 RepID=UPI003337CA6B